MAEMRDLGFFLWRQATNVVAMDRAASETAGCDFSYGHRRRKRNNNTRSRGIGFDYKTTEAESDFYAALNE